MLTEGHKQEIITAITSARNCIDAIEPQTGDTENKLTEAYIRLEDAEDGIRAIVTEADK